VVCLPDDILW